MMLKATLSFTAIAIMALVPSMQAHASETKDDYYTITESTETVQEMPDLEENEAVSQDTVTPSYFTLKNRMSLDFLNQETHGSGTNGNGNNGNGNNGNGNNGNGNNGNGNNGNGNTGNGNGHNGNGNNGNGNNGNGNNGNGNNGNGNNGNGNTDSGNSNRPCTGTNCDGNNGNTGNNGDYGNTDSTSGGYGTGSGVGRLGKVANQVSDVAVIVDTIINIGTKLWNVVKAGTPVVTSKYVSANGLPQGITAFEQMQGWSPIPRKRVITKIFKNVMGIEVVNYQYAVSYRYNGNVNGVGKYLAQVQVRPVSVSVKWGFDFDSTVTIDEVFNAGSQADPVASMSLNVSYTVKSAITPISQSRDYCVQGNGAFQDCTDSNM